MKKVLDLVKRHVSKRVGLLATQGIRGGANRSVLSRIKESGNIFFAESDREWVLDGANVHVSMIGFDNGTETNCSLDGNPVSTINANLTATVDTTSASALPHLDFDAFIGVSMHGPFEIDAVLALEMLTEPGNPSGRPNSDVIRPILNAQEIARTPENRWVIAFPPESSIEEACAYATPFEHVKETVKPIRDKNNRKTYRDHWWIHGEARPAMLSSLTNYRRCIATPRVGKHRVFVWVPTCVLPSDATVAFACDDDYPFGVLQSHVHEIWALKLGTRLETRPRYTPTTCFETFPFPEPTDAQREAIAAAAKELDTLRNNWLNPPEWTRTEILEFPGSVDGPWKRYIAGGDEPNPRQSRGLPDASTRAADTNTPSAPGSAGGSIATVRYPRIVPKDDECAKLLKKRTLTNLYNERPTWLDLAHQKLDAAVFAAYGWDPAISDDDLLAALLALNLARAAKQ